MEEDRRPRIEVPDLSFLPEGDDGMPASIKVSAMADVEDYVYDYLNRLHPDVAKTFAERTKRKFNEIQDPLEDVIEHYNQTKKKAKRSDSSSSSGEDSDNEADKAADLKQKNKPLVKKKGEAEKPTHTPAEWKWCVTATKPTAPAPAKKRRLE